MKQIFAVLLAVLCFYANAFSQTKGLNSSGTNVLQDIFNQQVDTKSLLKTETMPSGNVVESKYYYLGPGDVLTIQNIPILQLPVTATVSPEMKLIVPGIAELNVKNMTLEQTEDSLTKIFLSRNPNSRTNITIQQSRNCLVSIKGNVLFPSTYTLPGSYQVSTAVLFANHLDKDNRLPYMQTEALLQVQEKQRESDRLFSQSGLATYPEYWRRNITLLHKDGSYELVDIDKAIASNNPQYDPYIREGDEIVVPFEKNSYEKITISGAVNRPIVLPYKKGDSASALIKFGYGFNDKVDTNNVYLYMPISGSKIKLTINSKGQLFDRDYALEPGSIITVGSRDSNYTQKYGTVSIKGYVAQPGIYLIQNGETRLKEVIDQAGGFTENAYLPLAKIIRRSKMESSIIDPRRETYETLQYSDLTMDDTVRYFIDMKYKQPLVSVDFYEAFVKNNEKENIPLMDGDVIIVPENPGNVYVFGQVNSPGYVEYSEGKNMQWYIERAGGTAEGSEPERARIIRGRTSVWLEGDDAKIVYGGDKIYVPRVPDEPTAIKLQRYAVYSSIAAVLFGIVNILYNILNTK